MFGWRRRIFTARLGAGEVIGLGGAESQPNRWTLAALWWNIRRVAATLGCAGLRNLGQGFCGGAGSLLEGCPCGGLIIPLAERL